MPDEFLGPHRIDPAHVQDRLAYVMRECLEAHDAARALHAESRFVPPGDEGRLLARVDLIERVMLGTRQDEIRQWDRYQRPQTRLGRWAYWFGVWWVRLGRAVG